MRVNFIPQCYLCVLCASVVNVFAEILIYHRDTEDTEIHRAKFERWPCLVSGVVESA